MIDNQSRVRYQVSTEAEKMCECRWDMNGRLTGIFLGQSHKIKDAGDSSDLKLYIQLNLAWPACIIPFLGTVTVEADSDKDGFCSKSCEMLIIYLLSHGMKIPWVLCPCLSYTLLYPSAHNSNQYTLSIQYVLVEWVTILMDRITKQWWQMRLYAMKIAKMISPEKNRGCEGSFQRR